MRDYSDIKELLGNKAYDAVFNWLVQTHSRMLYLRVRALVGTHEDADDVLQDSFVKIWKSLPGFRGDSKLSTWAYQIASRTALDFIRSKKNHAPGVHETGVEPMSSWTQGHHMDYEVGMEQLIEAIEALPDQQRLVFILRYFEALSYEEIYTLSGTSIGGLKANYHHASKSIKKYLTR